MTELNNKNIEQASNKKFKKLLIPIFGLGLLLIVGITVIGLNPELIKNIAQQTNLTPTSSSMETSSKVEIKKTNYTYGDFPEFRMSYPIDWQIGSISTKQFSLTKQSVKAIITLEAPSVSGLSNITCNTQTAKVSDKITRIMPIGRSEYIYVPTTSIYLKGTEKYNDVTKSIDLSKASQSEKDSYAKADSCGIELFTSLTKTKLPANNGINSPTGEGWFKVVASGENPGLLKELDAIVAEVTGLYWE